MPLDDSASDVRSDIIAAFERSGTPKESTFADVFSRSEPREAPKDAPKDAPKSPEPKEAPKSAEPPKDAPKSPVPKEAPKEAPRAPEPAAAAAASPEATALLEQLKLIDPPAKWSKKEKEDWAKLSELAAKEPKIAQEILTAQRILAGRNKAAEGDVTRRLMEMAQERNKYKGLEDVLAPRRAQWSKDGVGDAQALQHLFGYYDQAQRDFPSFLDKVIGERGFDVISYVASRYPQIRAVLAGGSAGGGQPGAQPSTLDPAVAAELTALRQAVGQNQQRTVAQENWIRQQEQARSQGVQQSAAQELQAFESAVDEHGQPRYPFLQEVRTDMARMMHGGMAGTLEEAYDRAVFANRDTRMKLLESQEITRRTAEESRRAQEAARSKAAAASVGSSTVDYVPSAKSSDAGRPLSVREELERAWKKASQDARL